VECVNWGEKCLLIGGWRDARDEQSIHPTSIHDSITKAAGTRGVNFVISRDSNCINISIPDRFFSFLFQNYWRAARINTTVEVQHNVKSLIVTICV
jgi:hypothetical protein